MLTRLKLKRGEGKLVESPEVGSRGRRARLPQSPTQFFLKLQLRLQ